MKVKIKALDTFHDSRVGMFHAKQKGDMNEHVAKELEKLGFIKILGKSDEKDDDKPTSVIARKVTGEELAKEKRIFPAKSSVDEDDQEEKNLRVPENKMKPSSTISKKTPGRKPKEVDLA